MIRRLLDSAYTYFALAALLVVGWFVWNYVEIRPPALPQAPRSALADLRERDDVNVIFILIDTLRADRLGSYGYDRDTTPVMDGMAQSGVRFANHMAQSSWTKASMASLWTGLYPATTGVLRYPHGLPDDVTMPAEIFKEAGFHTAAIYRNGWVDPYFGFAQGFDAYFMPPAVGAKEGSSSGELVGTDETVTDQAREFLRSYRHRRFFLYLHYMDLHQYTFGKEFARYGTTYSDYYDNALAWTDANIGMLLEELIELDLLDKSLVVVTSDHGEAFREHGVEGHARNLYKEVLHIPLIMLPPFSIEGGGVVVEELTANVDLMPTLLDMLGLPALPRAEGRSLMPAILGEELEPRPVFAHLDRYWGTVGGDPTPLVKIMTNEWRATHWLGNGDRDELFSASDVPEERNLAEDEPAVRAELTERILEHVETSSADRVEVTEKELDDLRLMQLRALGYAVGGEAPEQEEGTAEKDAGE